jgi:cyclic pyranopterin phosphate synthase
MTLYAAQRQSRFRHNHPEPTEWIRIEASRTMTDSTGLSHLDEHGQMRMVDVGQKSETERVAIARAEVHMRPETLAHIRAGDLKKGDVFSVAKLAGIQAAKRTAELIPLCHPLTLTHVDVELMTADRLSAEQCGVEITATVRATGRTGVEMEALTAVTTAALTVYDMAKAVEKTMHIANVRLVEKRGGASGDIINE